MVCAWCAWVRAGRVGERHLWEASAADMDGAAAPPCRCWRTHSRFAAADDWPGGSPDPATEDRDAGTNAVLVRTPRGRRLVDGAVDAGYLTICNDVDPRYLDSVQPHQVKKKYNVRARWDALASAGHLVPRSRGLRLEMLSRELSREHYERQRHGTLRRLAEGQASEARPDSGGQAR